MKSGGRGGDGSRALDEEAKARVLAPSLLCDLRQAVNISGPQVGEKEAGILLSPQEAKGRGGAKFSFHFFIFSTKGLNENQLQRQRILL